MFGIPPRRDQFLTCTNIHHATPLITQNAKTSSLEAKPSAQDHICHIRTSSNIFLPFLQRRVYISLRKTTFDLRPGGSSVIYHSTQLDEIGKCLYVCVYVCMYVCMYVCIRAVSYTHLRAHETRHDLVCRLLLEKKKKI